MIIIYLHQKKKELNNNFLIKTKWKFISSSGNNWQIGIAFCFNGNTTPNDRFYMVRYTNINNNHILTKSLGGTNESSLTYNNNFDSLNEGLIEVCYNKNNGNIKSVLLDTNHNILSQISSNDLDYSSFPHFGLIVAFDSNTIIDYDYIFTSKLTDPEPTISYGNEETGNWTIDGITYTKRKKVIITNNSLENLIDYQIRLDLSQFNTTSVRITTIPFKIH